MSAKRELDPCDAFAVLDVFVDIFSVSRQLLIAATPMGILMNRWYVVKVKPREEHIAVINLRNQGFETFYPCIIGTKRVFSAVRSVKRPYFPGYMFVAFNLVQDQWKKILGTRGVAGMLGLMGDQIIALPAGYVEALMDESIGGVMAEENLDAVTTKFCAGDKIVISEGPMAGMTGEVIDCKKDRLSMLFTLLGRQNKVNIPVSIAVKA